MQKSKPKLAELKTEEIFSLRFVLNSYWYKIIIFLAFYFIIVSICSADEKNGNRQSSGKIFPQKSPSFPLICNLKHSSDFFVGREDFLSQMHEYLFTLPTTSNNHDKHYSLVISGAAGSGKTQVITRFAELHKTHYEIIWWFDEQKDLIEQYLDFARKWNKLVNKHYQTPQEQDFLQINIESIKPANIKIEVHDRLRSTKLNWLIIFDNVQDSQSSLNDLPRHNDQGYGHIIMATQNAARYANSMHLEPISAEESAELVLKITGEKDNQNAQILAKSLNGYPLAIVSAASFIAGNSAMDIKEYNRLFVKGRKELWEAEAKFKIKKAEFDSYTKTVAQTFATVINNIKQESLLAYELLAIISCLDDENIPESLLQQAIQENKQISELSIKNALSILTKYSILNRDYIKGSIDKKSEQISNSEANQEPSSELLFNTHELVQYVMHEVLGPEKQKKYLIHSIATLNNVIPNSLSLATGYIKPRSYLIQHMLKLIKYADELKIYDNEVFKLKLLLLDHYLYGTRDDIKAENLIADIDDKNKQHAKEFSQFDTLGKIRLAIMKSAFLAKAKRKYTESYNQVIHAQNLIQKINPQPAEEMFLIYRRLAKHHHMSNQTQNALKYAKLAKKIFDQNKTPEFEAYQKTIAKIMVKIALDNDDCRSALEHSSTYIKAISNKRILGSKDISIYLQHIDLLTKLQQYQEALETLTWLKSLDDTLFPTFKTAYKPNIDIYINYIQAIQTHSNLEQKIKTILAAQLILQKTLSKQRYNNSLYAYRHHIFLAQIHELIKQNQKAQIAYLTALNLLNKLYNNHSNIVTDDLSDIYSRLAINQVKLKQIDQAIKYFKLHTEKFGKSHPRSLKIAEYTKQNIDLRFVMEAKHR